jgi:hypothetical protein
MRELAVDQPTVTVAGEGIASGVPDTALLQLGVETRGGRLGRPWRRAVARWSSPSPRYARPAPNRAGWSAASSASTPTAAASGPAN